MVLLKRRLCKKCAEASKSALIWYILVHMAKNFILQLASLATLLASIPAFIVLLFSIINLVFPDAADSLYQAEGARESIRFSIATLVVFFPAYLYITRQVNTARRNEGSLYHTLTKWVIYIALLVAGLIMLGDLVAVVYQFLNGEITVRFVLKALSMFAVIGAAFWYYVLDARGYWNDHEKRSIQMGVAALVVVAVFVVYGFTMIETPQTVREQKIDQEELTDLQNMQYQIENYYSRESTLPASIADAYTVGEPPVAPGDRAAYSYEVKGKESYELCATFDQATPEVERSLAKPIAEPGYDPNNYNWDHNAGRFCFTRTVSKEQPQR